MSPCPLSLEQVLILPICPKIPISFGLNSSMRNVVIFRSSAIFSTSWVFLLFLWVFLWVIDVAAHRAAQQCRTADTTIRTFFFCFVWLFVKSRNTWPSNRWSAASSSPVCLFACSSAGLPAPPRAAPAWYSHPRDQPNTATVLLSEWTLQPKNMSQASNSVHDNKQQIISRNDSWSLPIMFLLLCVFMSDQRLHIVGWENKRNNNYRMHRKRRKVRVNLFTCLQMVRSSNLGRSQPVGRRKS